MDQEPINWNQELSKRPAAIDDLQKKQVDEIVEWLFEVIEPLLDDEELRAFQRVKTKEKEDIKQKALLVVEKKISQVIEGTRRDIFQRVLQETLPKYSTELGSSLDFYNEHIRDALRKYGLATGQLTFISGNLYTYLVRQGHIKKITGSARS